MNFDSPAIFAASERPAWRRPDDGVFAEVPSARLRGLLITLALPLLAAPFTG